MKKVTTNILWVLVAFTLAGCEPSPQGATAVKANPPPHAQTAQAPQAPKAVPAWFGDSTGVGALEVDLTKKNYYVVLDGSGSMRDRAGGEVKIVAAKKAISAFAALVPATANLGLLAFDGNGITERVPLGTSNRPQFAKRLEEVNADSGTPLRSAITEAYARIRAQARKQLGYGEYHLVIVTDGEANGGEDPRSIVNKILGESTVVIHTIGFDISTNHSLNQRGRTMYRTAADRAGLEKGLKEVLAEAEKF